ncbi:MAG TPA: CBS domain-containing protein [Pseudomonadales bacterium]|nr:CBS domain-containing protein [Pseudomonadales bacterium]
MGVQPLRVRDYMATQLITIGPEVEIMRAIHLLVECDISSLPVVDAQLRVVGILTERDCIRTAVEAGYFDETGGMVGDFMTTPVHTVTPDDSLMDIAELFADSSFRRCPVVADGRLVGLISRRDVLRALKSGAWFVDHGAARE